MPRIRWGRVFFSVAGLVGAGLAVQWMLAASPTVEDQLWLERLPRTDRDKVTYFLLDDDPDAGRVGFVQSASEWQRQVDLFTWSRKGSKARLTFPQNGHVTSLSLKAYACEGQAPKPFTLCLDIQAADGRKGTLYSHEGLGISSLDDADDLDLPQGTDTETTGTALRELL